MDKKEIVKYIIENYNPKSANDITDALKDVYGVEVSATMISKTTDKIIPLALEWQNRPLNTIYPIVFIDCVHFNVKNDNMVVKKAAYVVLGITESGYKEVFGIVLLENSLKYEVFFLLMKACLNHCI